MRIATLAVLAWGSACGGNVVVDGMPDGSGGAGAVGVSSTSVVGVGVSSTSVVGVGVTSASAAVVGSTGAGGGDARSRCMDYCNLFLTTCGQVPGSCDDVCDDQLSAAPACNGLLVPFFDCAINEVFDCDVTPPRCEPLLKEYEACAFGSTCGLAECAGGDRACTCKGSCPGVDLGVECRPIGGGIEINCSCTVNGVEVAACLDARPACELGLGCCEPIFDQFR
ncbi:hypothetical protein WMF04_31840 [Sorangium sp. So ce260]|uniref:hypothetical protein n=1 Tax=Sorangium sp. So ce260 TaxID=3133291 RepID=UPI003F64869E